MAKTGTIAGVTDVAVNFATFDGYYCRRSQVLRMLET
jgi:hypothetical protein